MHRRDQEMQEAKHKLYLFFWKMLKWSLWIFFAVIVIMIGAKGCFLICDIPCPRIDFCLLKLVEWAIVGIVSIVLKDIYKKQF